MCNRTIFYFLVKNMYDKHRVHMFQCSNVYFIGERIEGENFVMKGRSSAMLEKNDGKWLFRHVHSSVPDYDASEGNSFAGN